MAERFSGSGSTLGRSTRIKSPQNPMKVDRSREDLRFCIEQARAGCDAEEIDRRYRASPLYREKWERLDYRTVTIRKALEIVAEERDRLESLVEG